MECMATVYSNGCDVGVPVVLSVAQPRSLSKHFSDLALRLGFGLWLWLEQCPVSTDTKSFWLED